MAHAHSSFNLHAELTDLLPGIMNQLGPDNISHLKQIADSMSSANQVPNAGSRLSGNFEEDDDVPDLVENFEDISKL